MYFQCYRIARLRNTFAQEIPFYFLRLRSSGCSLSFASRLFTFGSSCTAYCLPWSCFIFFCTICCFPGCCLFFPDGTDVFFAAPGLTVRVEIAGRYFFANSSAESSRSPTGISLWTAALQQWFCQEIPALRSGGFFYSLVTQGGPP